MSKDKVKAKAEAKVDNFMDTRFMYECRVVWGTLKSLLTIYVPLALSVYILHTNQDKLVMGLGVAAGLLSLVNTVKCVWLSVRLKTSKKRRKA